MLDLEEVFPRKKAQRQVAEFLLRKGIRVSPEGGFFVGDIDVSSAAIARSLDLDRRVVTEAADTIAKNSRLMKIFGKLNSTLVLKDVASELGYGAIELTVKDPSLKGIIAGVAKIIADADVSIRQITTSDPMFSNVMTVVTEKPIPRELIDRILALPGVEKVIIIC
jgi:predicted regulator of amino acid metabolism with ACT domain